MNSEDKSDLYAKALNASDLVEYQDGAVVSRQLIKKEIGNITLFAFDQGEGLSEHTAPFDAMLYILDGEAEITIAGNSNLVREGELIIMPAHKPHSVNALGKFKMMLVMIRG
jgi:quercetin dioxygenase-like cupin family protein